MMLLQGHLLAGHGRFKKRRQLDCSSTSLKEGNL